MFRVNAGVLQEALAEVLPEPKYANMLTGNETMDVIDTVGYPEERVK
jgi:hypothetical protein